MATLGISREDFWYTPAVTLYRMQKAYIESQGEPQKWAKTRLDKMTEEMVEQERKDAKHSGT